MDHHSASHQLKRQGKAILSLVSAITPEEAERQPDLENWSIRQVLNHLIQEETQDFRKYLSSVWKPIEKPMLKYNPDNFTLADAKEYFQIERQRSTVWLQNLENPNLNLMIEMPWGQPLRAGDMLASWLAHDLLHLRQLIELCYALTDISSNPYHIEYAGEW